MLSWQCQIWKVCYGIAKSVKFALSLLELFLNCKVYLLQKFVSLVYQVCKKFARLDGMLQVCKRLFKFARFPKFVKIDWFAKFAPNLLSLVC